MLWFFNFVTVTQSCLYSSSIWPQTHLSSLCLFVHGAGRSLFYWRNRTNWGTTDTCAWRLLSQTCHHTISELRSNKPFFVFIETKQLSLGILPLTQMWWADGTNLSLWWSKKASAKQHFYFQKKRGHHFSPLSEERNFTLSISFAESKAYGLLPCLVLLGKKHWDTDGTMNEVNFYIRRLRRQCYDHISTTWLRRTVESLLTNVMRISCLWSQADLGSNSSLIIYNLCFLAQLFIFVLPSIISRV